MMEAKYAPNGTSGASGSAASHTRALGPLGSWTLARSGIDIASGMHKLRSKSTLVHMIGLVLGGCMLGLSMRFSPEGFVKYVARDSVSQSNAMEEKCSAKVYSVMHVPMSWRSECESA